VSSSRILNTNFQILASGLEAAHADRRPAATVVRMASQSVVTVGVSGHACRTLK